MKKKLKVLKQALKEEKESKDHLVHELSLSQKEIGSLKNIMNEKDRKFMVLVQEKNNLEASLLNKPTQ